jgi:copper homeostasis protein
VKNGIHLEICLDSVESALAAFRGGAHRVELCSNLLEGGTTPSAGLIATVREKIPIELYVMIRPRGGDFCYSADEFQTMRRDILMARQMRADGVVLGILEETGDVDIERTRLLRELARPLKVTFHRAFDMSRDLKKSLEDVILAGVDRVLTSGGEQNVEAGGGPLAKLVSAARDRIVIMPGGGITETNVRRIIAETGAREMHASLQVPVSSQMKYRNEKVSMGAIPGREYQRFVVLEDRIRELLRAAEN